MSDYYARAAIKARTSNEDPSIRASRVSGAADFLRSRASLSGVTVEDDGCCVLVHVGQPSRGVPAQAWLDALPVEGGEGPSGDGGTEP